VSDPINAPWRTYEADGWHWVKDAGGDNVTEPQFHAERACLIAAAPELLEALEKMLKWAPHFVMLATPGKEGRSLVYAGDVEAARDAIAKARGAV
jgi:hypothetical protein